MSILLSPQTNSTGTEHLSEPETVPDYWHILAPLVALCGGLFGILGAFYTELTHGSFLVAFVGAPMIEEAFKPSGVYLLLAKWPRTLRTQAYTALLAALGGIAFALVENVLYLKIYVPDPSTRLILWRYSVCVAIHALCSFIFGFGIDQRLLASIRGERKLLSSGKRFFFTAMALHSLYNIAAVLLQDSIK